MGNLTYTRREAPSTRPFTFRPEYFDRNNGGRIRGHTQAFLVVKKSDRNKELVVLIRRGPKCLVVITLHVQLKVLHFEWIFPPESLREHKGQK